MSPTFQKRGFFLENPLFPKKINIINLIFSIMIESLSLFRNPQKKTSKSWKLTNMKIVLLKFKHIGFFLSQKICEIRKKVQEKNCCAFWKKFYNMFFDILHHFMSISKNIYCYHKIFGPKYGKLEEDIFIELFERNNVAFRLCTTSRIFIG